MLDGKTVANGDVINLNMFTAGKSYNFVATATDKAYNQASQIITFTIDTSIQNMKAVVTNLYNRGMIKSKDVYQGLISKLNMAQMYLDAGNVKAAKNALTAFINQVKGQSGKSITKEAAALLIADANYAIKNPK